MKRGMEYFNKKKYDKAVEMFETTLMEAESPEIAAKAQLFLADAYFLDKKYEDAIPAYKQFLSIYSETEDAKLALMRLGLSHYTLVDTLDRDMGAAEGALEAFEKLREDDPGFSRENNLTPKIVEMREMLAGRELYVAKFYFRINKPDSAEGRLKHLIENFKDTKSYEEGLYMYAGWLADKGRYMDAVKHYKRLIKERPNNPYGVEIARELTGLLEKINEKIEKEAE
jgi:outer membrane protein assembly factor BamD